MIAAWLWLKKYWEYVAATALLFLGVFVGLELKKRPVIVAGDDHKKEKIDEETAEEEKAIQERAIEEQHELRVEQVKELTAVVEKQKRLEPKLGADPDATNDYLMQAGRDARGDDHGEPE